MRYPQGWILAVSLALGASACGLSREFRLRDGSASDTTTTMEAAVDAAVDATVDGAADAGHDGARADVAMDAPPGVDVDVDATDATLDGPDVVDAVTVDNVCMPLDAAAPDAPPVDTTGCTVSGTRAPFTKVGVGVLFACALNCAGDVWCWGSNEFGQLANVLPAGQTWSATPVHAPLPPAIDLAVGADHACVIDTNRSIWCWGRDEHQELGGPPPECRTADFVPEPQLVSTVNGATMVAAGGASTCAWSLGGLYCWGDNTFGQTGTATNPGGDMPPALVTGTWNSPGSTHPLALAVGQSHTCVTIADNMMDSGMANTYCWGRDDVGQTGRPPNGMSQPDPTPVTGDVIYRALAADRDFTVALAPANAMNQSGVTCWGNLNNGHCGDQSDVNYAPIDGLNLGTWFTTLARSSGYEVGHGCAIEPPDSSGLSDRRVVCWGENFFGQAGAAASPQTRATEVLQAGTDVAVGQYNGCAVVDPGEVFCWGAAGRGVLGRDPSRFSLNRCAMGDDGGAPSCQYSYNAQPIAFP